LLPPDLAAAVNTATLSPLDALHQWLNRAESDTAEPALRRNVAELKRLAHSIAQHGLISPISVRLPQAEEFIPPGVNYLIVTGERRYWAHVYLQSQGLSIQAGQTITSPEQIKISLTPSGITVRAYQLIENLLREDLNAIERAKGLWALRYELSGVNYSSPLPDTVVAAEDSLTLSDDATVNYSSPSLAPWARVEEVLGISKRYRIFMLAVLQLSETAQNLVAAHNLAEMTIRPITQKLRDKPDLQLQALRQLIEWQKPEADEGPGPSIVASIKEFVDQLLINELETTQAPLPSPKRSRAISSAPLLRFRDKVKQTLDFLSRLKKADRAELARTLQRGDYVEVMLDLRLLREEIDTLLQSVPPTVEPTAQPSTLIPPDSTP
jgi:hypothetical protein